MFVGCLGVGLLIVRRLGAGLRKILIRGLSGLGVGLLLLKILDLRNLLWVFGRVTGLVGYLLLWVFVTLYGHLSLLLLHGIARICPRSSLRYGGVPLHGVGRLRVSLLDAVGRYIPLLRVGLHRGIG